MILLKLAKNRIYKWKYQNWIDNYWANFLCDNGNDDTLPWIVIGLSTHQKSKKITIFLHGKFQSSSMELKSIQLIIRIIIWVKIL